jgi:hypothetical protein
VSGGTGGGSGTSNSITGSAITYASGGNTGSSTPSDATANTGNGGNGAFAPAGTLVNSGNGGSGVVILSGSSAYSCAVSEGLTYTVDNTTIPGLNIFRFTAGTGTIIFSGV